MGIGNPYRGDDGIAWEILRTIEKKIPESIFFKKSRGDIGELLETFQSFKTVILIDACLSGKSAGSWERINALKDPLPEDSSQTSTHGFNVGQAIALARNLKQLPSVLILYAISGDRFGIGDHLSEEVGKAIDPVVEAILNEKEIRECMNIA